MVVARPTPGVSVAPVLKGVVLLVLGAISVQLGAALGTSVIPAIGVLGIVLARYLVMASVHVPASLQHLRKATIKDWRWGLLLAVPMLAMNTSIYMAFSHIGVGLSVTIELLGPITLAVISARSWPGWIAAFMALIGMLLVTGPTGSATPIGAAWAVLAAASWALYLVAARVAGQHLPGLTPSAMAGVIGLTILIPATLLFNEAPTISPKIIGVALLAGLLSSAIPYAFDVIALRLVPMNVASTMMSLNPVFAVLWGAMILNESFGWAEALGLVIVCAANVLVVHAAAKARARTLAKELPQQSG